MQDEPNTPLEDSGTDNVAPSEDDTPDIYDYFDPDEDQDTEETVEDAGTDDETDEAEADNEDESQETEDDEDAEPKVAISDETEVSLPDGSTLPLSELKKGYLRQSDFSRKTQELANVRSSTEAEAKRIAAVTDAFIDHIAAMLPPEPSPALAQRDPNAYTRQKAAYDVAVSQVQKIIEASEQAKETVQTFDSQSHQELLQRENQSLAEKFPETTKADTRQKFFSHVSEAAEAVGFSTDELTKVSDHRLFALAHWAKRGMEAEKAKEKAREKVKDAPPSAPRKPGQTAAKAGRNKEAMRKAVRSGRLDDVLAVDFDF